MIGKSKSETELALVLTFAGGASQFRYAVPIARGGGMRQKDARPPQSSVDTATEAPSP
jgi:hypothetical protein